MASGPDSYDRASRLSVRQRPEPLMLPYPIETAPKGELDHEPVPILLFCPDEGGWHTGVWFAGVWRLHADIERELDPTHWLPAPPDVVVE